MFSLPQESSTPAPAPNSPNVTQTKRQQIAELLAREIANDRWPVQTVRSAIATLQQRGLITTRKGLGTKTPARF